MKASPETLVWGLSFMDSASTPHPLSTCSHLLLLIGVVFQPLSLDRVMLQAKPQPRPTAIFSRHASRAVSETASQATEGPRARPERWTFIF